MSRYLELQLIGVDGSVWDVSGPRAGHQGVEMLPKTKRLLSDTPAKTFWIKSGSGQKYQSFQYQRRDPLFGFATFGRTPDGWADIDSRFRAALGYYDDEFTIKATTQPDNTTRTLAIRLLDNPTSWESDWEGHEPFTRTTSTVMVDGACQIPHWTGEVETRSWTVLSGQISGGNAASTIRVGNPGDVPIFPRWLGDAPPSGTATWRIADYSWGQEADFGRPPLADVTHIVPVLPNGVVPGEDWQIDTDDDNEYIVAANGSPLWTRTRGQFAFYPIAAKTPATDVPVSLTGAAVGMTITIEMDRYFTRAWGVSL